MAKSAELPNQIESSQFSVRAADDVQVVEPGLREPALDIAADDGDADGRPEATQPGRGGVEQLAEGGVKQVAGHAGTIFCFYEEKRSRTASSKAGSWSNPAPSSVLSVSAISASRKA